MNPSTSDRKRHWEAVYNGTPPEQTSWHQPVPALSLEMILRSEVDSDAPIIDVGGGASLLADQLLANGFSDLTVLDISAAALHRARRQMGSLAEQVKWIESDITGFEPMRSYQLWHDRAAFHFLTQDADRNLYLDVLQKALMPGGQVIIAAFTPDGPRKCSGLEIVQYEGKKLQELLGEHFILEENHEETHTTPQGREQRFGFYRFRNMA